MKRFIAALAFCLSLLVLLSLFLFPPVKAKEDPIAILLSLPAPPPPNPLASRSQRDENFYDASHPPDDNAPIEDLIDYWTHWAESYNSATPYSSRPSERTAQRLAGEIANKPELATQILSVLPENKETADVLKTLYDRGSSEGGLAAEQRLAVKEWLRYNSSYFSNDLEKIARETRDSGGYVDQNAENNVLALTRHDFDRASPIINRMYADTSQPVSQVLATWALYRHALETDSLSDIERYRSELMRAVENRNLPDGVRDKANDALTLEKDFPGRDDWTFSLFEDETLVNMPRFTMLTTLITRSPPEKYAPKLIELLQKTSNPTVRSAAVRNLSTLLARTPNTDIEREIVNAMLPWLEDPKWAPETAGARATLVGALARIRLPDSVPGLIHVLDEKQVQRIPANVPAANRPVDGFRVIDAPSGYASNANIVGKPPAGPGNDITSYPLRSSAVVALGTQKDPRAIPHLRRVLPEMETYERSYAVKALLSCGGFSVSEQLDALEAATKTAVGFSPSNTYQGEVNSLRRLSGSDEIKSLLTQQLLQSTEISDELARAVVDRIESLEKTDPQSAAAYRKMILKWQNAAINVLLLSDVKRGNADADTIVRLLSQRKELREKQPIDVFDVRTGNASAIGIAACLVEDPNDYAAILDGGNPESKTAMLACARLIRAPLSVGKVAENLGATIPALSIAAERYLESEDSPEARRFVLSRHPGEAKILGATTSFTVEGAGEPASEYLWALYQSLGNNSLYYGWAGSGNDEELVAVEKRLRAEVKKDDDLLGIYGYDKNYIRIYKDRVVFSWDEDDSRYRERPLTKYEFDDIKAYLTVNRADEMPPFLSCGGEYCSAKELVMVGRNGGRRVYTNGVSDFFTGLDKYFADLKKTPAILHYALSREIPGLEIVLASDELHVETVWKNGDDLRVAASLTSVRERVKKDIEQAAENAGSGDATDEEKTDPETVKAEMARNREYDGYGWHRIVNGVDAGPADQPAGVEYIPLKDSLSVKPSEEQWKARYGNVEVRSTDEGVYLVSGGRVLLFKKGNFGYPVMSPNGRWAVVGRIPDEGEGDGQLFRINLATRRVFPIAFSESEGYTAPKEAVAFVPVLNKFLIVPQSTYYGDEDYTSDVENGMDDTVKQDVDPGTIELLDAETGAVQKALNELRPLAQQTFRPLQKGSQPDEYWAAMPDAEKNETRIGIYNAKWLTFKAVRTIPKIQFNSMSMWVDEAAAKVYFVYRGHLLALPLNK